MAKADYILCDRCDSKIVYDGDGKIMDALTALGLDKAPVLCEACRAGSAEAIDYANMSDANLIDALREMAGCNHVGLVTYRAAQRLEALTGKQRLAAESGGADAIGIEAAASAYERLYIDTEGQCSPHDVATAVVAAFFAAEADVPEEEDARQICPECSGDGYVASRDAPHQWADDSDTEGNELVTCRECCGLGYL